MFLRSLIWAILWAFVILILCAIPGSDIPYVSFLELISFDKLVHASMFFILIYFTIRGFANQTSFEKLEQNPKLIALIICIIYGGSLEIMQGTLFDGRNADLLDFIANSFGCMMGYFVYEKLNSYLEKKFEFMKNL